MFCGPGSMNDCTLGMTAQESNCYPGYWSYVISIPHVDTGTETPLMVRGGKVEYGAIVIPDPAAYLLPRNAHTPIQPIQTSKEQR